MFSSWAVICLLCLSGTGLSNSSQEYVIEEWKQTPSGCSHVYNTGVICTSWCFSYLRPDPPINLFYFLTITTSYKPGERSPSSHHHDLHVILLWLSCFHESNLAEQFKQRIKQAGTWSQPGLGCLQRVEKQQKPPCHPTKPGDEHMALVNGNGPFPYWSFPQQSCQLGSPKCKADRATFSTKLQICSFSKMWPCR